MEQELEKPVFYDYKGRRWQFAKFFLLIAVLSLGAFLFYITPKILHLTPVTPYTQLTSANIDLPQKPTNDSPTALADKIARSNAPVIGSGPLTRIVQIEKTTQGYAAIPVYGGSAQMLTPYQSQAVGSYEYAIERYGQGNDKRIALTFDDGPDPTWTPKILDELSAYHAKATFFEIGHEIEKYPAIAQRVVREGHVIGNHTFNHVNFDTVGEDRAEQEINQTQRVIRAETGYSTSFLRLPYGGNDDQSMRDFVRGILEAQKQGYVVTYYQYDSNDWEFTRGAKPQLPTFDGSDMIVLMHDGGGDRSHTLPYLASFIKAAREHGYTFVTLNEMYSQSKPLFGPVAANLADKTALYTSSAYLVWPHELVTKLFLLTILSVGLTMTISALLAYIRIRRVSYKRRQKGYLPLASIVVPAYNEEKVLAKTVSSLLRSYYRNIEVIIVDDGSSDQTWGVAQKLAKRPRVRAYCKANGGKSSALNLGVQKAKGDIIITIDADTIFLPTTVGKLVRHFADGQIGAVAGAVKVGNIRNALSRWQALDYTIGIYIERNAQALLGAIMIVPGACGAWRKDAIQEVGGYSATTLAEDFDLTLAVHKAGYKILQDNDAIAYTETPLNIRGLFKQRYRWIFGDIQTFWKYRHLLLRKRYRWLGLYALPLAAYSILMPLVFGPLLLLVEFQNILAGNYEAVLIFFAATIVLQFIFAAVGLLLARERLRYLAAAPLTRILYGPIRSFILYRSVVYALKGSQQNWGKLQRTDTLQYEQTLRLAHASSMSAKF